MLEVGQPCHWPHCQPFWDRLWRREEKDYVWMREDELKDCVRKDQGNVNLVPSGRFVGKEDLEGNVFLNE